MGGEINMGYKVTVDSGLGRMITKTITRNEVDVVLKFINNISPSKSFFYGKIILKYRENGSGSTMTTRLNKEQLESAKALVSML